MSSARAICAKGHGHERGRACPDCLALERERYLATVKPLADTLERLPVTVPAEGPWSAAGADILGDLSELAEKWLAPPCQHRHQCIASGRCFDCGLSCLDMMNEQQRAVAT